MVVGLVLAALFVLVLSIVAFLLILGSALLGVPLISPDSVETAPSVAVANAVTQPVQQQTQPERPAAPVFVTEAAFLAAQPPEAYVYDSPAVDIRIKTENGFSFESITVTADNGRQRSFDNNTIETDLDYAAYAYAGYLPSINTHVVRYTQTTEEGAILISAENAFSTRIEGRLFKVPQRPSVIVQHANTLQLFEQQPDGLFASRWNERIGTNSIVAVARDLNGTLLLKREALQRIDANATRYLFQQLVFPSDRPL